MNIFRHNGRNYHLQKYRPLFLNDLYGADVWKTGEFRIRKDLEGDGCDLIAILLPYLPPKAEGRKVHSQPG